MTLSADSQVIAMLCTRLALPDQTDLSALKPKEWDNLARSLFARSLRPENLLDFSEKDLMSKIGLSAEEASRIWRLLQRRGNLALELEQLERVGIHILTRADNDYPKRYYERLGASRPPALFYAGEKALLGQPGIAVVGSRKVDEKGKRFAEIVGNQCARAGFVLYTGGAKGVDMNSMRAVLQGRGQGVAILADSLERAIRNRDFRDALSRKELCLATPYLPRAGFTVGAAMGRNKLIYALADYAIVIASDLEKGGTWFGAVEALKERWLPVFVVAYPDMPAGNRELLNRGAIALPADELESLKGPSDLLETLKKLVEASSERPAQVEAQKPSSEPNQLSFFEDQDNPADPETDAGTPLRTAQKLANDEKSD